MTVVLNGLLYSILSVQIVYSGQLNCTDSNYRVTVVLNGLLYSILSVQIVYSVQLNCTDSNYTEAAATCSAAQQHSTFTVQILYKLYSLQLNCTYSNYTKLLLHVQLHNSTAHLLYKYCTNCTVCN